MNAWGIVALCLLGLAVLIFVLSYICMRLACRCYRSVTADLTDLTIGNSRHKSSKDATGSKRSSPRQWRFPRLTVCVCARS